MIPEEVYNEATSALGDAIVRERLLTRVLAERDATIAEQAARIAELEQGMATPTP